MTGRQGGSAQVLCRGQHIAKLYAFIAAHTGDRRFARQITVGEVIHHAFAERVFIVENIMRNAELISHLSRIVNILPCTARTNAPHRFPMIIKLQRNPDDIIALFFQKRRRHGRVNAPRHGDNHAGIFRATG